MSKVKAVATALAFLASTGCAHSPQPLSPEGERIVWEDQPPPFCGRCDSLKVTARSDGLILIERGHWAGSYQDWRATRRWTHISPSQFDRLRDSLAAIRPQGHRIVDERTCADYATDQGGFAVAWRSPGREDTLRFDVGCSRSGYREMGEALEAVPRLLGLADGV